MLVSERFFSKPGAALTPYAYAWINKNLVCNNIDGRTNRAQWRRIHYGVALILKNVVVTGKCIPLRPSLDTLVMSEIKVD